MRDPIDRESAEQCAWEGAGRDHAAQRRCIAAYRDVFEGLCRLPRIEPDARFAQRVAAVAHEQTRRRRWRKALARVAIVPGFAIVVSGFALTPWPAMIGAAVGARLPGMPVDLLGATVVAALAYTFAARRPVVRAT